MIDFDKPSKRTERRAARKILYLDLIFIVLPFILLIIIQLAKNSFSQVWQNSDWSIAATIMSGQALVRYYSGLMKYQGKKNVLNANIYGALLLLLSLLCLLNFAILQLTTDNLLLFQISQIILFIISIRVSIVFGSIGQLLYDLKRKKY